MPAVILVVDEATPIAARLDVTPLLVTFTLGTGTKDRLSNEP